MQNFLDSIWAGPAAVALGCLVALPIIGLAEQDRQTMIRCEQAGRSVTACRLAVYGR